jgi:ferric-dicitrate binding protein FerR (iron transport regulator)
MRNLVCLLLPAALFAGPARYARLGDFEGVVEVQLQPADAWMPAERNLPLPEGAWLRTGNGARLEVELDDGSVLRLGSDSAGALADMPGFPPASRSPW